MEKVLHINWSVEGNETDKVERYCHNCGKKVEFTDSLKRRQNANGKDIYHFAIYKCDQGHTWNMKIESFKAVPGLENNSDGIKYRDMYSENSQSEMFEEENSTTISIEEAFETIDVSALSYDHVNITVHGEKKIRLDKLLSERLGGISRNDIKRHIESGNISIGGIICKYKQSVKDTDIIFLNLTAIRNDMRRDLSEDGKSDVVISNGKNNITDRAVS